MESNDHNHFPAVPCYETWDRGLLFIDICGGDLPVEQLGQAIITNYAAGMAAGNEAKNRLVAAGLLLIDVKSRNLNFEDFLKDHCKGLSHSWAYDLIAIAEGRMDEVRAKARARKLRHRQKRAAAEAHVRSGTDTGFHTIQLSQEALIAQFEKEFDAWVAKLDDERLKRAVSYVLNKTNHRRCPTLQLTASV
jgi:hypothetical protein